MTIVDIPTWCRKQKLERELAPALSALNEYGSLQVIGGLTCLLHFLGKNIVSERLITVCDACYVALAERLGLALVTADDRLVRHLEETGLPIKYLGDLL